VSDDAVEHLGSGNIDHPPQGSQSDDEQILSPDGSHVWDGTAWIVRASLPDVVLDPSGDFWWDDGHWRAVTTPPAPSPEARDNEMRPEPEVTDDAPLPLPSISQMDTTTVQPSEAVEPLPLLPRLWAKGGLSRVAVIAFPLGVIATTVFVIASASSSRSDAATDSSVSTADASPAASYWSDVQEMSGALQGANECTDVQEVPPVADANWATSATCAIAKGPASLATYGDTSSDPEAARRFSAQMLFYRGVQRISPTNVVAGENWTVNCGQSTDCVHVAISALGGELVISQ
jgi:hypothetical protein